MRNQGDCLAAEKSRHGVRTRTPRPAQIVGDRPIRPQSQSSLRLHAYPCPPFRRRRSPGRGAPRLRCVSSTPVAGGKNGGGAGGSWVALRLYQQLSHWRSLSLPLPQAYRRHRHSAATQSLPPTLPSKLPTATASDDVDAASQPLAPSRWRYVPRPRRPSFPPRRCSTRARVRCQPGLDVHGAGRVASGGGGGGCWAPPPPFPSMSPASARLTMEKRKQAH